MAADTPANFADRRLDEGYSRVAYCDDQNPVVLRPNRSDSDVGTARVLAEEFHELQPDSIRIRIEKSMIPIQFLNGESEQLTERPTMEFVGRIVEVGEHVSDLVRGTRVCGFGPAEAGSHLFGKRSDFALSKIEEIDDAYAFVSQIHNATRVSATMHDLHDVHGKVVLVELSSLGLDLANELSQRGARVILAAESPSAFSSHDLTHPCAVVSAEELDRLMKEQTCERGFDIIAVDCSEWSRTWGWMHLARGGVIVDLGSKSDAYALPAKASKVIRTSIEVLAKNPTKFAASIQSGIEMICDGRLEEASCLEIPLSDIAWQKLPLNVSLAELDRIDGDGERRSSDCSAR